jgi:hypothetical protein
MHNRHTEYALMLVLGAVFSWGCSDSAGGPQLARLSVSVSSNTTVVLEPQCVRIPLLWGSRSRQRFDVEAEFTVVTDATRDGVTLTLDGVENAAALQKDLGVEVLRGGYSEEFDVVTLSGAAFSLNLSSMCQEVTESQ